MRRPVVSKLLPFDGAADEVDPRLRAALQEADALLISAGPDAQGDPVCCGSGRTSPPRRNCRKSSISPPSASMGTAAARRSTRAPNSSRSLRSRSGRGRTRLAGAGRGLGQDAVYFAVVGHLRAWPQRPGQSESGKARRLIKPGQVFNRIHVEDIGRAIAACFSGSAPGGVYNVTDNEPAPPQDVIVLCRWADGNRAPARTGFSTADLTPMARSFYGENKRVSNARMKTVLGVDPACPTYREGIAALWKDFAPDSGKLPSVE